MSADNKKRVLIVANELSPYLEYSDFAQILNKLAIKSFDSGLEVRVIMPRFGTINERRHRLHEVVRLSGINVIIDKDDYHCHGWMTSLLPLYLKTAYKKEPVFSYSKVIYTAQADQFSEKLGDSFIKKALISNELKEKDFDPYKDGSNQALRPG